MRRRDLGRGARPGWALNVGAGLAAGLSLLGVLSACGGWNERLDLLNHATPAFLAGGLLGLILAGGRPTRTGVVILAALGAAGALAAGARVVPDTFGDTAQAGPSNARQVTVLTQNVWDANRDPHGTARILASAGADIVLLQELQTPQARIVARDLEQRYPYHADCSLANRWCSLAILSRLPISTWSYHQGGWKAPDWDRLVLVRATIDAPGLPLFEVIASKLAHPYTGDLQRTQIPRLVDKVRSLDQRHAILAGDFNLTPWSFALARIDRSIDLIRRTRGLATWPNRLPFGSAPEFPAPVLPIDQVYAGAAWRTIAVRRGPRTGSDHYGVMITLAPTAAAP